MKTTVSIEKAVAPLLVAALLALISWVSGNGDLATVLLPVSGLLTFGVVYMLKWAENKYTKTFAAVAVPLLVAGAALLQPGVDAGPGQNSGMFSNPVIYLVAQAVLGGIGTYMGRRYQEIPAEVVDGGAAPGSVAKL